MKKWYIAALSVGLICLLPFLLMAFVFWRNDLPWNAPPGKTARLAFYLSENRVETTEFPVYPELKSPEYTLSSDEVFDLVKLSVKKLGWQITLIDADYFTLEAVATTPLLRFKDDIVINVSAQDLGKSRLKVISRSRMGVADFGTNTRHILDLKQTLARHVKNN